MFGPNGEPLDFGDSNGEVVTSDLKPGLFNTTAQNPEKVGDPPPPRAGGTVSSRKTRQETGKEFNKTAAAKQRGI